MRRIGQYDELAPLLTAQLKRGVATNALMTQQEYRREIAEGGLWVHQWEGGLLLLRRRPAGWRMNFYLHCPAVPLDIDLSGPVVTEIALRQKDTALQEAAAFWKNQGFVLGFQRQRMALPEGWRVEKGPFSVVPASPEDREEVQALLEGNFDPLTGCLPSAGGLEESLQNGQILLARDAGGAAAGLLHIQQEKRGTQLRHLAVAGAYRRRGAAQSLLSAYLGRTEGRSLVWVRCGNGPAVRFYEKNGYQPDGWTSEVLIRRE